MAAARFVEHCHHRSLSARWSSPSRKKSFPWASQEQLWHDLFQNPTQWWDVRQDKATQNHPDFRHKDSGQSLWLNSLQKPSWVDACLASLHPPRLSVSAGHEIGRLCEEGKLDMALDAFLAMDEEDVVLPELVYYSLLKTCNKRKSLDHVLKVQAHLFRHQLNVNSFIGDYLVVTLARCGAIEDSCDAFNRLHQRTVFSWTAIISAHASCGKVREALTMYREMCDNGIVPDNFAISCVLKVCSSLPDLDEGRKIHAYAEKSGFTSDVHVGSTLLSLYGKRSCLLEAEFLFVRLCERNIISWNIMLSAYVEHNEGEKALLLYRQLQAEHVGADQRSFVISLQACCILVQTEAALGAKSVISEIGRSFHADLWRQGLASDVFINNTLVSLYAKCGCIQEAENVFCGMSERNIMSWNEILAAYLDQGECEKALQLYSLMQFQSVGSDERTHVLALQACWMLTAKGSCASSVGLRTEPWLEIGEALHADTEVKNLSSHVYVGNSLVHMYRKCGKVREAEKVFQMLVERDIVSWNAMLSAYIDQAGYQEKALELYMQMEASGQAPDDITFSCLLRACSGRGSSDFCRVIHFTIVSSGWDHTLLLLNTLLHAYGCCASMADAEAIFDRLPTRGIVSWNALIAGHALNGNCIGSLECFEEMQKSHTKPDGITFLALFLACSHAGFVDMAFEFLGFMADSGIALDRKHLGSLVDLLGRAGDFQSLESILWKMPLHPDATLWSSLLGACQMHYNVGLARQAFGNAMLEQPEETNPYVLMGNIYAKGDLHNG